MPLVSGGQHLVFQHDVGLVLGFLEFVAHDRKFLGQVLGRDLAADHAVGLQREREVQVVGAGGQLLEVVRAIPPGGAVEVGAVILQQLPHVGSAGRALEQHVFQEVRHAGLAVALQARAHEVRDVDQHGGFALVREDEDAQPVVQTVFGDALDRGHLGQA